MFVVLGLLLIMTACQTVEFDDDSVEGDLNVIVQTRHIPAELSITYSDMHGLWGGTKITINGAGSAEIQERDSGEPLPRTLRTRWTRIKTKMAEMVKKEVK